MTKRAEPPTDPVTDDRRVEWLRLADIVPAERNPRSHDIPAIKRSIARFGFAAPAMRDERTGRLVVGHGRVLALLDMEADPDVAELVSRHLAAPHLAALPNGLTVDPLGRWAPRGIRIDADGGWIAPVIAGWSSTSDADADAYLIADNRMTELTNWDQRGLADMLSGILAGDEGIDLMLATGYDRGDLDDLLAALEPPNLDDLGGDDPDPADMWPTVSIRKVPPHVAASWRSHVDTFGGNDVEALASLLEVDPLP